MVLSATIADVERLRGAWSELRQRQLEKERADAPRHNVFRLLRMERSEVGLHSALLRDLLDPYGSHGQGLLFLRSFLQLLATRTPVLREIHSHLVGTPSSEDWLVETERDRIDISIRNREASLIIFIENKIDAAEQENQLTRYQKLLYDERHTYSRRVLVFLAPRSYGAPKSGPRDFDLTYEDDIALWLEGLEPNIQPTTLQSTLRQYRQIIQDFRGDQMMSDTALVELLAKPENIRLVLEICHAVEDVKKRLFLSLWEQIATDLTADLATFSLAHAWTVDGTETVRKDSTSAEPSTQAGIYLVYKEYQRAKPNLWVGAWREGSGRIFYGIRYSVSQPTPHPLAEVRALRENIAPKLKSGPNNYWIGSSSFIENDADDLLRRLAEDVVATARPISSFVMDLLREHLDAIEAANYALANSKGSSSSESAYVIGRENPA